MIGAAAGSIIFGVVAENKGRKFTLILSLVWFGTGTVASLLFHTWGQWMVLRFVTCIGVGGVWGPAVALIARHWSKKYAARASSFMLSTFAASAIFAAMLGRLVLEVDWRILYIVAGSSIIAAVISYAVIPSDKSTTECSEKVRKSIGVKVIFEGKLAKITILATLLNVANMGGYWGFGSWAPSYLTEVHGLSLAKMSNFTIVMYVGMFIGYQAWSLLADKIGRKKVMFLSFLFDVIAISMYLIIPNGNILFWWGAVVGFGFGGVFGVMGAYYNELFPERISALGGGFCFNVGRLGSVIAPFTVGLIGEHYGLKAGLMITPIVFGLGLIAVALLPETMNKEEELG